MRSLAVLSLLLFCACPGGLRRPQTAQVLVSGAVTQGGTEGRGDPLEGASIVARRRDTGAEVARNVTSASGGYRLDVPVEAATALALVFSADGHAPVVLAADVTPHTELSLGVSLEPLEPLECTDASCDSSLADVRWSAPPLGAVATARSFTLAVDAPLTVPPPGSAQQVLALAFVSLGIDGGAGGDGGLGGELRLRVPVTGWPLLEDAVPGSGALEVQAAAFDVARGAWVPLAPATLYTESGLVVPESALSSIRGLDFAGGVVAALPPVGPGFVAVLGGAPLGCVQGTIDADGQPGEGATVGLGVNLAAADSSGAFCAQAPVGSAPRAVALQYAGLPYRAAEVPSPAIPGTCGGSCAAAGKLSLKPETLVAVSACAVRGVVVDTAGQPVAGAVVAGYDASVTPASFAALCGPTGARCSLATATDASGHFKLVLPVQTDLTVRARTDASPTGQRFGALRRTSCPTQEETVTLDTGRDQLTVTASWSGAALSWDPRRAASRLVVVDALGAPKWELASAAGMLPPVTFGQVPLGAVEMTPAVGAAASGDVATVVLEGTGSDGVQYFGVGAATRP